MLTFSSLVKPNSLMRPYENVNTCALLMCKPVILQEGRPEQRNLSDSAALAEKVARKAEMKKAQEEDAATNVSSQPVVRKKVPKKKNDDLDDLLGAGLSKVSKGKKK